jgi:hypothetical protein
MKKSKYSKFIVLFIIIANIIFTGIILYIFFKIGHEPTTLIISWFGFTTGELAVLGGIKAVKEKNKKEDDYHGRI